MFALSTHIFCNSPLADVVGFCVPFQVKVVSQRPGSVLHSIFAVPVIVLTWGSSLSSLVPPLAHEFIMYLLPE